jgi:Protein of unknown function (DUF3365)
MKARNRVAQPTALSLVALLIVLAWSTLGAGSNAAPSPGDAPALPPPSNGAISPQNQADALHFVIAADREMYCRTYIARQTADAPPPDTSAGGKPGESWPSPCEMLRRVGESIQSKGAEFSYALRSLHPIDPRNEPQTELEQRGLDFVSSHPAENYYGQEMLGGRRYVTAVYPDLPAVSACIDCHNRRAASLAQRYQVGEVMGGVVVRVPLEF